MWPRASSGLIGWEAVPVSWWTHTIRGLHRMAVRTDVLGGVVTSYLTFTVPVISGWYRHT
jgi:hypothetical protein